MKARVLVIFGTRPEAIKQAPVVWALRKRPEFELQLLSTGQHREMLQPMLELLDLQVDHDLDLMQPGQTLTALSARTLLAVDETLQSTRPDVVLVQGDTTTAMASALAAFHRRVPVGHVEAGLRSGSLEEPFPEEVNRIVVDSFARYLFAPTTGARDRLLAEGASETRVSVTGNTLIDALLRVREQIKSRALAIPGLRPNILEQRFVLLTCHRRESFGHTLRAMMQAIAGLADRFPSVQFVYPVHLNPNVQKPVRELLGGRANIHLLPPLDYEHFVALMSRAYLVLSDSGGVQEEAPSFGVPLLVLRNRTERPEGVEAGCSQLVGTDPHDITEAATRLLSDEAAHAAMAHTASPYGDGRAGERIADILERDLRERRCSS